MLHYSTLVVFHEIQHYVAIFRNTAFNVLFFYFIFLNTLCYSRLFYDNNLPLIPG